MEIKKDSVIEALNKCVDTLKECQYISIIDTEKGHADADDALRSFLKEIGYGDVVVEFDLVNKWYS